MEKNRLLHFFTLFAIMIVAFFNISYAAPLIPSDTNPEIDNQKVADITSSILGTMQWIGYVIAIGMLIFVGVKYVMASADEKASMKGVLVKVAIGIVIIMCAELVVGIIRNFA
ncbi:MAG: hypothetical protein IJ220_05390 [Clostridia bacterium]|nr:hypothetical protein [Clostridia bacterium]